MSTAEFNAIVEDFEFIDDWEDRYRYIIEKGKNMPFLDDALKGFFNFDDKFFNNNKSSP